MLNSEEQVQIKDLRIGDIMVFEGEKGDLTSELIMLLTKSPASHGALYLKENTLVDAGLSGIGAHPIGTEKRNEKDELRIIHIRRLKNVNEVDITPVIDAANNYISQNLPYPMSDLIMLGLILIYKDVSHVSLKQKLVIALLKKIMLKVEAYLDKVKFDGKHPMVCSDFVYQCYLDATKEHPELELGLKDADLQVLPLYKGISNEQPKTLLDHYARNVSRKSLLTSKLIDKKELNYNVKESESELIQGLLDGINDEKNDLFNDFNDNDELNDVIGDFIQMHQKLKINTDVSSDRLMFNCYDDLIKKAMEDQATFVTPNDLYCHLINVDNCGQVNLYRYE